MGRAVPKQVVRSPLCASTECERPAISGGKTPTAESRIVRPRNARGTSSASCRDTSPGACGVSTSMSVGTISVLVLRFASPNSIRPATLDAVVPSGTNLRRRAGRSRRRAVTSRRVRSAGATTNSTSDIVQLCSLSASDLRVESLEAARLSAAVRDAHVAAVGFRSLSRRTWRSASSGDGNGAESSAPCPRRTRRSANKDVTRTAPTLHAVPPC